MGCFDTFVGKIECPHCKQQTNFEKQTKKYECFMQELKVGDYIDKGNTNYFYEFECPCEQCKKNMTIFAGIRRGQLIGYYTDITGLDINAMDNIEEGYQRNVEYKQMCESGYGLDECLFEKARSLQPGGVIHALKRDWTIEAVFEEQLKENSGLPEFLFRCNRVYQVHDADGNKRLIVIREGRLTLVTGLIGDTNGSTYVEQLGTELVRIC